MRTRTEPVKAHRPGRAAVHPYDEWFTAAEKSEHGVDLIAGDDFEAKVSTMRHNIYREGKNRGYNKETLKTATIRDENATEVGLSLSVITAEAEVKPNAKTTKK